MIKRRSITIAVFFLTAIMAVLILGTGVWRKLQLDTSSQEFVLEITPRILTEGTVVLQAHATSALLQDQPEQSIDKYLYVVSRNLGELELIESISGSSEVPLLIFSDNVPTAYYEINVSFSGGPALVKIQLLYDMQEWLISAFEVESSQLAD